MFVQCLIQTTNGYQPKTLLGEYPLVGVETSPLDMLSKANVGRGAEPIRKEQQSALLETAGNIVKCVIKGNRLHDVVNNIPHVDYVEFFVWLIIRGSDVLDEEFNTIQLLEFLDARLGDIYPADICALLKIPFNEEARTAAHIKNMLSIERRISEKRFYAALLSAVNPSVVRLAKVKMTDASKIETSA